MYPTNQVNMVNQRGGLSMGGVEATACDSSVRPIGLTALDSLDQSVMRVASVLDALEESLSRVLAPQPPSPCEKSQGNTASQNSHITDRINQAAIALEMIAARMEHVRKRIEV